MTFGDVTPGGRVRVLADGNQMPMLGLGVWQVPNGAVCVERGTPGARPGVPAY